MKRVIQVKEYEGQGVAGDAIPRIEDLAISDIEEDVNEKKE